MLQLSYIVLIQKVRFMLDQNAATPLYQQLATIFIEKIENGEYVAGSQLPTEAELQKQYDVSRVTVRQALKTLADRELIERRTGKGTFVAEKKLMRKISTVMSFSDMCRMQGYSPGAKTVRIDLEPASTDDIQKMNLNTETNILLLERIRYADGIPVVLERSRFPEKFLYLMNENLNDQSLYDILKEHGTKVSDSLKTLDIIFANYKESMYLNINKNHSLLRICSVVTADSDGSTHLSEQLCVSDRFKLYI